MVRIVASLSFRLRDTTSCTASTADGPASQTACITSFSKSVKGARKRASLSVRLDMVQRVPLHHVIVKNFLNEMSRHVHMKTITIRELHLKPGWWVRHAASGGPI